MIYKIGINNTADNSPSVCFEWDEQQQGDLSTDTVDLYQGDDFIAQFDRKDFIKAMTHFLQSIHHENLTTIR